MLLTVRNKYGHLVPEILKWDVRSWSAALVYWEKHSESASGLHGLELGSNEGGISLWMAMKGMKVTCSDLQETEKTAGPLHTKYSMGSLVTYQDINATDIPYENHFDVIVFKSIIGGIGRNDNKENQYRVFKEIHKALKPGGKLLFAENLVASPFHRFMRKRFVQWGDSWRYITLAEMQEFLKPFSHYETKTTGVMAAFGRSEKQRSFLAGADGFLFNHVCPRSWKYIVYGMAVK